MKPTIQNQISENVIQDRYKRAEVLMQADHGSKKLAFNTDLLPNWIGQTDCFWYIREVPMVAKTAFEFRLVDAKARTNEIAFNHQDLANVLGETTGESIDADQLPVTDLEFDLSQHVIAFSAFNARWEFYLINQVCRKISERQAPGKLSPDGSTAAFVRDHNVWVLDISTGQERALTTDGERCYSYGSEPTVFGHHQAAPVLDFLWSPDSKSLFTHLIDTRQVSIAPPLVDHVPLDRSKRPKLLNKDARMALPGDEHLEKWQLLSIHAGTGAITKADHPPCAMVYPVYQGFFETGRGWWDADSRHAYFIDQTLDRCETRVIKWDTLNGRARVLFKEDPELKMALMPTSHLRTMVMPLPETNEIIWYSERSGWAHLYLYDQSSGKLKHKITSGDWQVRGLLHYNAEKREIFIQTAGRLKGQNLYYCDICRVNIDSGELTDVFSGDFDCTVQDKRYTSSTKNNGVSPTGQYIVTTCTRMDAAPVSLLLDRNGSRLMTLETADITAMPDNWRWPESVMLKAADGETDIYGLVYRPSDFSENKSYPVLDLSWGYSPPVSPFTGAWAFYGALAWAELGFVVVKFGNRGGGLRNRAFRNKSDRSVPYFNKQDCVAGIQQLAQRYTYIDSDRVGVASYTLYPEALTGLLLHPEVYKVGVDINPMSDPHLLPQVGNFGGGVKHPGYEEFVQNLKGKLLLIHGMKEDVVLVASTLRLVESLQETNKRFDMLLLPNMDHLGPFDYATKRSWDYMVEHLLEVEPPEEFRLSLT